MWKQAIRSKLRFDVVGAGRLSAEQLWTANVEGLMTSEEELQSLVEKMGKTTRRQNISQSKEAEEIRLKLAIITDVLDTREAEAEALRAVAANKESNKKILEEIQRRKELKLTQISDAELEAMLK